IPKASLMVDVRIAMQQTKIAADTTSRYVVVRPLDNTSEMIVWGPANPATALLILGTAIRTPHRKITPITNAPITEARTAFGASRRGFRVSSASVLAVSN